MLAIFFISLSNERMCEWSSNKRCFPQVVVYDSGAWKSGAHLRTAGLQQVPPGLSALTGPLPCKYCLNYSKAFWYVTFIVSCSSSSDHPFFPQSCATAVMHPVYHVHSEGRLLGKWTPTRGWWRGGGRLLHLFSFLCLWGRRNLYNLIPNYLHSLLQTDLCPLCFCLLWKWKCFNKKTVLRV